MPGPELEARPPRVLIISHFARGEPFGGSQRTTAMAERLTSCGVEVFWVTVPPATPSKMSRIWATMTGRPEALSFHRGSPEAVPEVDAVIAVHSYMAHQLCDMPAQVQVLDFQNLEWVYMREVAENSRGVRRYYRLIQCYLMRRYERGLARREIYRTFCTETELQWAELNGSLGSNLLLPNVLPSADASRAERIWQRRLERPPEGPLLYLGTLTYPPNVLGLMEFLTSTWPHLLEAMPSLELEVVGRADPETAHRISSVPHVRYVGFVPDLEGALATAPLAVLPVTSGGGSSMRALHLALAGVPMIGPSRAFRSVEGLAWSIVDGIDGWVEAIGDALAIAPGSVRIEMIRRRAKDIQTMDGPWTELVEIIRGSR